MSCCERYGTGGMVLAVCSPVLHTSAGRASRQPLAAGRRLLRASSALPHCWHRTHKPTTEHISCRPVCRGRGVDQILPHHCDPTLYESCVRDARAYVQLATTANGPPPAERPAAYPWGVALRDMQARSSKGRSVCCVMQASREQLAAMVHARLFCTSSRGQGGSADDSSCRLWPTCEAGIRLLCRCPLQILRRRRRRRQMRASSIWRRR